MTTVISEVYEAFREAGISEEKARKAAEALSADSVATKSDITHVEKEIVLIKGKITLVQWMLGIVIAVEVLPILKGML